MPFNPILRGNYNPFLRRYYCQCPLTLFCAGIKTSTVFNPVLRRNYDLCSFMARVLIPVPFNPVLRRYYDQSPLTLFCAARTTFYSLALFARELRPVTFNPVLHRYYDQDLALARDLEDRMSMGRAYCNLGLAHLAIGNMENALECQKYFLGKFTFVTNPPPPPPPSRTKRERQRLVVSKSDPSDQSKALCVSQLTDAWKGGGMLGCVCTCLCV